MMRAERAGVIGLVSSVSAIEAAPMEDFGYTSAKAALNAFAKKLAVVEGSHGIRAREPLNTSARSAFQSEKPQIVWCDTSDSSRSYGRVAQRARCGFSGETLTGQASARPPPHLGSLMWNDQTTLAQAKPEPPAEAPSRPRRGVQRFPNALLPGSIEFPGGGWEMMREQQPEIYEMVRQSVPSGRLGTPKEIADAAVWLVSPRAGWVNGAALVVDGGQSKAIR